MMDDEERERLRKSFSAWLAMGEYLDDMRLRNCSSRTIREYEKVLINYFLETDNYSLEVSRSVLRAWIARMYERGLKASTVATRVGVLRAFFRFAFAEGLITEDRSVHLPRVKVGKHLPKALTADEVRAFMAQVAANGGRGRRDLVVFTLMYACGLRVSEVVALRAENVDLEGGSILVVAGKGNKDRRVFLKESTIDLVAEWLGGRESGWLFPGQGDGHLSARVVQHYAREYGQQIGLTVHPHMLRHSCATHYLTAGAPITFVQKLLGHAKLSTTGLYTQLADRECQRIAQSVELAV